MLLQRARKLLRSREFLIEIIDRLKITGVWQIYTPSHAFYFLSLKYIIHFKLNMKETYEIENDSNNHNLIKIEVDGLYDAFDHPIELKKEGITLILGENGLGKTLILKMIKSFFDKDFYELDTYHFKKFTLFFDDNSNLSITKSDNSILIFSYKVKGIRKTERYELALSHFTNKRRKNHYYNYFNDQIDLFGNAMLNDLSTFLPHYIERVDYNNWIDRKRGRMMDTNEIVMFYREFIPSDFIKNFDSKFSLPQWLINKTDSVNTKFIETQRLLSKIKAQESEYHSSVIKYSKELLETIKNKTVAATGLASKLDRSYPNRVINEITKKTLVSDLEIEVGLANLNKRRELLNKVGLLDTEEENLQPITNAIHRQQAKNKELLKDVLQIYLEDSNQKLEIYSDLVSKLDLLLDIINKRFLYKKMSIDKKTGFVFTSLITGKDIPLSGLSSGEQHELVLFYQLLFNTEPDSLLLIDEPEISLHISWQNHFIDDLRDVIKLNNFSVIIATHSPDIINNNWDLTVRLKGV